MGIIRNQATVNAAWVSLGVLLGALNNVVVLPLAFEDFKEGWGLLKTLVSYSMIIAPFVSLGSNAILIKYLPTFPNRVDQNKLNGLGVLFAILAFTALTAAYLIFKVFVDGSFLSEDFKLILEYVPHLLAIILSLALFQVFAGYCVSQLKTISTNFLGDTYLKAGYLILAASYLFDQFSFDSFLLLYVVLYVSATILLAIQAYTLGFRLAIPYGLHKVKEIVSYGVLNILDRASATMVLNLDIVMIGAMMGLSSVADYTLAFFIGTVTIIPHRAIQIISNPLTSKALAENDSKGLDELLNKVAINQILLGGLIFLLIWANIDAIMTLLPPKFQNGKWVVFYIGLSKLTTHLASNTSAIMVYSRHYVVHLYFTVALMILTWLSNLWLIPIMGIEGAALATFMSLAIFAVLKFFYVHKHYNIHPFHKNTLISIVWILVIILGGYYMPWFDGSIMSIILKATLLTTIFISGVLAMKLSEDMQAFYNKWKSKLLG